MGCKTVSLAFATLLFLVLVQGRLISLWIGKAVWTRDEARGHIDNVVFKDIRAVGKEPRIEFTGFSDTNVIENVALTNVAINGEPVKQEQIKSNAFVRRVNTSP